MEGLIVKTDLWKHSVWTSAVTHEDIEFLRAVMTCMQEHSTPEKVQDLLVGEAARGVWFEAVRRVDDSFFAAIISYLEEILSSEQIRVLALEKVGNDTLMGLAFERKDDVSLKKIVTCLKDAGPLEGTEVAGKFDLDAMFSVWAELSITPDDGLRRVALEFLSYLLANYAIPQTGDLLKLSLSGRQTSDERFKTCCLQAVSSAANPCIAGINLSVALCRAAKDAQEGEKRALTSLQSKVDNLLLEIFERLPQTVGGFNGGMGGCSDIFEPKWVVSKDKGPETPRSLRLALKNQQQRETFCKVPLVMDYLSRTFTSGLPDLRDTGGVLQSVYELRDLLEGPDGVDLGVGLSSREPIEDSKVRTVPPPFDESYDVREHPTLLGRNSILPSLMSPGALLQGANVRYPCLTFLSGAQFISAGLVAKPGNYYRVPKMRMALDLVVYLIMLVVFSGVVLSHDNGELLWGEYVFMAYIVAGCLREGREMYRDRSLYFEDRWNLFDILGLVLLSVGLGFRIFDRSSQRGQALYALSAPLMFSRVLFFAQIHHFQGPMINVIFSMTDELIKFGFVMVVVVIGFAVSFHALFGNADSFGETLLSLFKAMLGEVGFFDEFSGGRDDVSATILLVAYLVIMTIMLLNLLVAILSTSHANVQANVDQEFRVSKARMIDHYRLVVTEHLLPAPFNLVQLLVSFPCVVFDLVRGGNTRSRSIEAVGHVVFWLVLGPISVILGSLLWMTSAFSSTFVWRKHYLETTEVLRSQAFEHNDVDRYIEITAENSGRSKVTFMTLGQVVTCIWCLVGAPLYLLALWLRVQCIVRLMTRYVGRSRRQATAPSVSQEPPPGSPSGAVVPAGKKYLTIEEMLTTPAGGVGADDLRKHLEDPMIDVEVREDERKRVAKVEHVKLLRNYLENHLKEKLAGVAETISKTMDIPINNIANEQVEIKQKVADIKQEVADIKQEVADIKQEVADIKHGVAALKQNVEGIEHMMQEMLGILQAMKSPPAGNTSY